MLTNYRKDSNMNNHDPGNKKLLKILGIALVLFSYVLYAGILIVPFTSFTVATKGVICTVLLIIKEISWWVGVFIVGKEFLFKYLKSLNIFRWAHKKQDCYEQSKITSEDRSY